MGVYRTALCGRFMNQHGPGTGPAGENRCYPTTPKRLFVRMFQTAIASRCASWSSFQAPMTAEVSSVSLG